MSPNQKMVDVLGVGIGPFNLSVAALLSKVSCIQAQFFDRSSSVEWHPGILFDDATIQVNYLKDLVTLVDPTNPYSFVAYLAAHKRLYRFITAKFDKILRKEFSDYLHWVSGNLSNLHFNEEIKEIQYHHDHFDVLTSSKRLQSKHLLLGTGLTPTIPACAKSFQGQHVFHGSAFLTNKHNYNNKRVLVIGGGQSGAEIVNLLLKEYLPQSITWVGKRPIFSTMDDSIFANEYFTPSYVDYFFDQTIQKRQQLLKEQTLASDGISPELLQEIYQLVYQHEFINKRFNLTSFIGNHELCQLIKLADGYQYTLRQSHNDAMVQQIADMVILCTGYHWEFPEFLTNLKDLIQFEGDFFKVNKDYSIDWLGNPTNRIYVQNAARQSHGVADPNLSLMAWRSATIINSLANQTIYELDCVDTVMSFQGLPQKMEY